MSRRSLIERIGTLPARPLRSVVFRSTSPGYSALGGEGARVKGGRWNPPTSFPVLYVSSDPSAAAGEIARTARRYGVALNSLLPRQLTTIRVELGRVLDLTDPTNVALAGLTPAALSGDDLRICQAVGDAAHYLGFEALLAPSVAAPATTIAIFLNALRATSSIEIVGTEILDNEGIT